MTMTVPYRCVWYNYGGKNIERETCLVKQQVKVGRKRKRKKKRETGRTKESYLLFLLLIEFFLFLINNKDVIFHLFFPPLLL